MAATAAHYTPRTKIRLLGFLRKKYFKEQSFLLDRGDTREAVKAIDVNYPGFAQDVADAESRGLRFAIFKNGKNIGQEELDLGGARDLWFIPVIQGSKRAGLLQTVIGVALIVVASFMTAGTAATAVMGAGIANTAGGVIQILSPQVKGCRRVPRQKTYQVTLSAQPRTLPLVVTQFQSVSVSADGAVQLSLPRSARRTRHERARKN